MKGRQGLSNRLIAELAHSRHLRRSWNRVAKFPPDSIFGGIRAASDRQRGHGLLRAWAITFMARERSGKGMSNVSRPRPSDRRPGRDVPGLGQCVGHPDRSVQALQILCMAPANTGSPLCDHFGQWRLVSFGRAHALDWPNSLHPPQGASVESRDWLPNDSGLHFKTRLTQEGPVRVSG